jgi:hypothetical protein
MCLIVAKIDALQAEYSAFETLHETDDLIATARELNVAYVAYSPLGHGWLVDDFQYNSPDDFAPGDFRRSGPSLTLRYNRMLTYVLHRSAKISRRKLPPQQSHRDGDSETSEEEEMHDGADSARVGGGAGYDCDPGNDEGEAVGGELGE